MERLRRAGASALAAASLLAASSGCASLLPKPVRSTLDRPPTPQEMAELWEEPKDIASRDLFHGVGGRDLVPDPKARYEFLEKDITGFSRGWDVRGPDGLRWSVKIGLEAQPEVVSSRIVWAAGYRQPPTYYVRDWRLTGSPEEGPQYAGRFRPELPHMKRAGNWSWHRNPFVGTRPYKGLIVLMRILNNWDLLDGNNVLYTLDPPRDGVSRWYVVRDLGATLGKSKQFMSPQGSRNNLPDFEEQGFVRAVVNGDVKFDYRGRHRELDNDVTPADVRWICDILARLSDRQLTDAFRAAGYDEGKTDRYVRKIRAKVEQGRALGSGG